MWDFDPRDSFGEAVAQGYDDNLRGDEQETVRLLRELVGDGVALEFAIGTGRIALPLSALDVRVDGIELSEAMISRLRAKPGGDRLVVEHGDMSTVVLPNRYRLIYLVYNTIFNLLTQDGQVRCFENAARQLDDDGIFLVEASVAGELYHHSDQYVDAERLSVDEVIFDVGRYDAATQRLDECHVSLSPNGIRIMPIVTRYASPSELDLMARLAGLRLVNRWGGWEREPFTRRSLRHVSVYARQSPATPSP